MREQRETEETEMSQQVARTPGAKRAGDGEYVFDLAAVNHILGGPDYSTANGACVEGDRRLERKRSRPNRARWSTFPPTSCTPARPRPRAMSCSSRARMRPTACTASRRRDECRQQTVFAGGDDCAAIWPRRDNIARLIACFSPRAWTTIDGKLIPMGVAISAGSPEDVMKRIGLGLA